MNKLLKSISYIFHPLLMPLLGVLFYFSKTPRFIPEFVIKAKIFSVTILTVVLPILIFYLLRTINKVETVHLKTPKERKLPLIINSIILTLIVIQVLPKRDIPELHFFFIGILISTAICYGLAIVNFKASIHMIGTSGFFMFALALAFYFKININGTIIIMCTLLGAVATSRLHMKAHTPIELLVGFVVGFTPQLILLKYWP